MSSLYAITSDVEAIFKLLESAVDEDGNPRELTEDEMDYMKQCFNVSADEFSNKFDSYCKLIKNYNLQSENADSERKNYKAELDRLSKRAKVYSNNADRLKGMLRWAMETLHIDSKKTDLFSAKIQNTQMQVSARDGYDLAEIPEKYLKPRELDTMAVKNGIKDGTLRVGTDGLEYGRVYDSDGNWLKGIWAVQGTALVIR